MNPPPNLHTQEDIMRALGLEGTGFPDAIAALAELAHQAMRAHTHPQGPHATPAHILTLARRILDDLAPLYTPQPSQPAREHDDDKTARIARAWLEAYPPPRGRP